MSWLYKHPRSGNWFIGWRVNKKLTCRSTGTANLSEAKKKLATLELMEQAQSARRLTEAFYRSLTAQEIIKVPFLKAVATFLAQAPAGGTRVGYTSTLRVLGEFLNANEQAPDVADISRAALQRHLDEHAVKTSVGTANHHRKVLNVFFNFCAAEYRITSPLTTVKKIEASTGALRAAIGTGRRPFTADELLRAYAVANPFWRFAMVVAYHAGFRLGMIATLRWGNVDIDAWTFTIIDNKHRKAGKRTVSIQSPALRVLLRSLRDATPTAAAGDYIFPAYATKYLSTPNRPDGNASELSREFHDDVLVGAGLAKKYEHRPQGQGSTCKRAVGELTFHSIEHTTVTTLKAAGVPEMVTREVAGHDSRQVSSVYTHASQEHMANALRLLPEVFTA
jgi:integrase